MGTNQLAPTEIDRLQKLYGLPAYWKAAEAASDFDGPLSDLEYADGTGREYPIHTKSATWLSNARLWETAIEAGQTPDTETADRLMKAATFWGIDPDVHAVLRRFRADKVAYSQEDLSDDEFALVRQEVRAYPISDSQLTSKSAETWLNDRPNMPLEWRQASARGILKAAKAFQISLPDHTEAALERSAGLGVGDSAKIAQAFVDRAARLDQRKQSSVAIGLCETAEQVGKTQASAVLCQKTAMALDALDRQFSLHTQYRDGRLELPEDVCFAVRSKDYKAAADLFFKIPRGGTYAKDDLPKVASALGALFLDLHDEMSPNGMFDKQATAHVLSGLEPTRALQVERLFGQMGVDRYAVPA